MRPDTTLPRGSGDVRLVHHLRVGQLDRPARLERPVLAVLHRHEAGLATLTLKRPAGRSLNS